MSRIPYLLEALDRAGWDAIEVELESDDWWSLKIFRAVSMWSPVGLEKYVSFEIDPQRPKDRTEANVWTVALSRFVKATRTSDVISSYGTNHWEKALSGLIDDLQKERNEADFRLMP